MWATYRKGWSLQEIMLTLPLQRIPKAPTVQDLIKVWMQARANVKIQKENCNIQGHKPPALWIMIGIVQGWFHKQDIAELMSAIKALGFDCVGKWADGKIPDFLPRPITRGQAKILEESNSIYPANMRIEEASWKWEIRGRSSQGWNLSTKCCRTVIAAPNRDMEKFQKHWCDGGSGVA
ncbi:hypothetical protein R1sor_000798 [Riccia sorocarpa]|uniref:Uncharacterized protein n=1 Tax=Riccia sorocarpa TaxID=122646 RepID=A0ABD3GVU7_9MARC